MRGTERAYVLRPGEAPAFWQIGNLWRAMATGVQTGNRFCLLDQVCTSDGGGPPTHTHTQDEGLYVISGRCTFHAGGQTITTGPGGFAAVPRHTPHSFTVDAPDTQLLNFYLPAGFEMILIGLAHPAERDEPPPPGVELPPRRLVEQLSRDYGQAKVLGLPFADPPGPDNMATTPGPDAPVPPFGASRDTAPAYWDQDILWLALATGEQTAGVYSLLEQLCPLGAGAPPHLHEGADEGFYVLDGEARFLLGDKVERAGRGSFVWIPRGTPHGFRVEGSGPARLLNLHTPAGFEQVITRFGRAAGRREIPPTGLQSDADPERQALLFTEIGLRPLAVPDPFRGGA